MYCDIITSIKTYFHCCVNREHDAARTLKKNDIEVTADGERSPGTFDDLTASISGGSNSSSSWSLSSSSSGDYDHHHYHQDLSHRIQSHNNKLFHPFLHHTGGTVAIP